MRRARPVTYRHLARSYHFWHIYFTFKMHTLRLLAMRFSMRYFRLISPFCLLSYDDERLCASFRQRFKTRFASRFDDICYDYMSDAFHASLISYATHDITPLFAALFTPSFCLAMTLSLWPLPRYTYYSILMRGAPHDAL